MNNSILYKIVRPLIVFYTKVLLRPKFIGLENIPNNYNYILAGNHTNNLDCFLLITASKRDVHFLAKHELFKGFKGIFFGNMGLIPVDRKNHTTKAFDKALKYLNHNKVIGIFPEGTYPKKGEKLLDFKSGVVKLSKMTETPIIPFIIKGKYRIFFSSVTIEFLEPYTVMTDNYDLEIDKFRKLIYKNLED
jgi:1-acyl-sn-glycerol-3-phosphate acyltransferase